MSFERERWAPGDLKGGTASGHKQLDSASTASRYIAHLVYRLARPVAATKFEGTVGRTPSAFSLQLLNQDGEHAFDFHGLR